MKKLVRTTTALSLSLTLAVPAPVAARGEFVNCALEGQNLRFPCSFGEEVIRTPEELADLIARTRGPSEDDAARQAAEDAARAQVERDEAARVAAQQAAEAEAARQEEERARAEEELAARQAAERAAAEEAERQEAERARAKEELAARQAAERAAAEEAQRQEAESARAEEELAARQAEERAAAEEAARQEAARQEAERLEEERRAAERAAVLEERLAAGRQAVLEEQRRHARAEELAAAAAAAEAAAAGQAEAQVTTEEIEAEEVRRADEEFDTSVTGQSTQAQQDDGGLSKFEKALLLGLGAAVVGSVLKNGDRVVSNSGDRVVVEDPNGDLRVLKDDDALIRRPGDEVRTETFNDGSSRTIVSKPDGSQIVTIRGRDGTVLRRISIDPQGREYVLFDDLQQEEEIVINDLPQVQDTPTTRVSVSNEDALRAALQAEMAASQLGRFSLRQVREIQQVRALAPELELDAVRFETGSAAIRPEQARSLTRIGNSLRDLIAQDPRTVILVEGHTDAVGSETYNLALSDRRAETVALALTEYFGVPPENMVTQGYGESALKVPTQEAELANRRAVVRNITPLLRASQ